ncbi:hypothetical protein [Tropicibacter oceani]|uniref:DUF3329 domain-containing protein n=1 Tax=Tropicibacter oceani TaxID=3058420 RepID=A0ABY8QLL5_9RHOB|nr:hypothetical protein [Tropicibacter oceani]WGW05534.1 hypothetical protein QF118_08305 [Tropicibacter oceani]
MTLLDPRHPFFRPLWRRVLIVALCFAWALFELVTGAPVWALLFAALGGYCAYLLLITFDPQPPDDR